MGIKAIPGPKIFGLSLQSSRGYYYIIFAVLVIMVFCTSRILKSRTGRAWISIRENGAAAASIGINTAQYKTMNIMYATFWEGCAGAFMATYYHFVDSSMFVTDESFNILSMAIIGGMGTIAGPLVGALLINIVTEAFRFLSEYILKPRPLKKNTIPAMVNGDAVMTLAISSKYKVPQAA